MINISKQSCLQPLFLLFGLLLIYHPEKSGQTPWQSSRICPTRGAWYPYAFPDMVRWVKWWDTHGKKWKYNMFNRKYIIHSWRVFRLVMLVFSGNGGIQRRVTIQAFCDGCSIRFPTSIWNCFQTSSTKQSSIIMFSTLENSGDVETKQKCKPCDTMHELWFSTTYLLPNHSSRLRCKNIMASVHPIPKKIDDRLGKHGKKWPANLGLVANRMQVPDASGLIKVYAR